MTVSEIARVLEADILCLEAEAPEMQIKSACGSDMMSDVLAFVKDQGLLMTGLINPQVVRTCEMMDILCIVFVRGKRPEQSIIDLARQKGIIALATRDSMFTACGKLYKAGLEPGRKPWENA